MKYALIIPDGAADEPQEALGNRTPLQAADVPAMDEIARRGIVGQSDNVPRAYIAGSDVATMNLLGYDVERYFTGRAPLEAAAQGISLAADDWAIRCNLVTIEEHTMRDFTAGHISSDEAAQLLRDLQASLGSEGLEFRPGVSYRNLLLYRGRGTPAPFAAETHGTPPHDLTDQSVLDDFPRGPGSDLMYDWMSRSGELFAEHPVNQRRRQSGQLPATHIWLWGLGQAPRLPAFHDRFGLRGQMITAVDLLRGLARLVGWQCIDVPGATGYTDTDYAAKGRYAIDAISRPETDLVCVHIEAPDEASHEGDTAGKLRALEAIDAQIVAPLHAALQQWGEYRILVSPDHPTLLRTKTHCHGLVPWALCGTGVESDAAERYDERSAQAAGTIFPHGHQLMERFIGRSGACH